MTQINYPYLKKIKKVNPGKLIALLFIGIVLAGCSVKSQVENDTETELELPVIKVFAKDTVLHNEYVADIQAFQNVELRARVQGFLEKVYVDEGQEVKKGQLLFKTNDEEYKAELAKANANLQSAMAEAKAVEFEVDRLRILVEKNVVSSTELDVALAKLEAVKAHIGESRSAKSNAAIRLSYTSIRAPFDGIIDRIPLTTGSLIDHGTLLTTASDVSSIYVYFSVSESEYLQYVKTKSEDDTDNSTVRLTLADGSPYGHEGKIETMEGEFKGSTGSIAFRARFPNPDKILKHGASGRIILFNNIEDALMIPQKAVFEIQDKNYVFIVDSTNTVTMKNFIPKTRFSHYYIIESGLEAGDKVVFEGIQNLRNGMKITPRPIDPDTVVALNNNLL